MNKTNWSVLNWAAIESASHELLATANSLNELIGSGANTTSAEDITKAVAEATSTLTRLQAIATNRLH